MAELSRHHTIAPVTDILDCEVCTELSRRAGIEKPPPLPVFGIGVSHAFGQDPLPITPLGFDPNLFDLKAIDLVRRNILETEMLRGPSFRLPSQGIAEVDPIYAQNQVKYEIGNAEALREWGHSRDRAHRMVLAQEALDLIGPIQRFVKLHPDSNELVQISREWITQFLLALPSKGIFCRMRMTAHENPNFKWHKGDLNDMTALAAASAYCNIVVTEKKWGSVLQRHQQYAHATILTSLYGLMDVLVDL